MNTKTDSIIKSGVKGIMTMKAAIDKLLKAVTELNSPIWSNDSEIFSLENLEHEIKRVRGMVDIYNILCPDEQIGLTVDDESDNWTLIPVQ